MQSTHIVAAAAVLGTFAGGGVSLVVVVWSVGGTYVI